MQRAPSSPRWPYVCIVVCLFIMAVTATKTWQSIQHYGQPNQVRNTAPTRMAMVATFAADGDRTEQNAPVLYRAQLRASYLLPELPQQVVAATSDEGSSETFEDDEISPTSAGLPENVTPEDLVVEKSATDEKTPLRVASAPVGHLPIQAQDVPDEAWRDLIASVQQPALSMPALDLPDVPRTEPAPVPAEPVPMIPTPSPEPTDLVVDEVVVDEVATNEVPPDQTAAPTASSDSDQAFAEPEPVTSWPCPDALLEQLQGLTEPDAVRAWAQRVAQGLGAFDTIPTLEASEVEGQLEQLQQCLAEVDGLSVQGLDPDQQSELLRCRYALQRRVDVWQQVHTIAKSTDGTKPRGVRVQSLSQEISKSAALIKPGTQGDAWRKFLLLDELGQLRQGNSDLLTVQHRELAQKLLARLEHPSLSEVQRHFIRQPAFQQLAEGAREWTTEPIDNDGLIALLESLEDYEFGPTETTAGRVASCWNRVVWSADPALQKLETVIATHYRNANVRVAVSETLINQILPDQPIVEEGVAENILGADVRGRSASLTRIWVRLLPDGSQLRLLLEAKGLAASDTSARKGPVTMRSEGESAFSAQKGLRIGQHGVTTSEARASSQGNAQLQGLSSDFDDVPLLGGLVRAMAKGQHERQQPIVNAEVNHRVANKAKRRMDRETEQRLADAEAWLATNVMNPLSQLGLNPLAMHMETTNQRAIMRCRLASDHQLAASTPRPRAHQNSVASCQVHESAINNLVQQLAFDGYQGSLESLYRQLAQRLQRPDSDTLPEDLPDGVTINLPAQDAVRVTCAENRVTVTAHFAKLSDGSRTWRNFTVRAHYVPQTEGLRAQLVRDGVVELQGERLGIGDQVALRGIFNKVFSQNRPISILPPKVQQRLEGAQVAVDQFVIVDGWIGVSLAADDAEQRVARRKKLAQP